MTTDANGWMSFFGDKSRWIPVTLIIGAVFGSPYIPNSPAQQNAQLTNQNAQAIAALAIHAQQTSDAVKALALVVEAAQLEGRRVEMDQVKAQVNDHEQRLRDIQSKVP